MLSKVAFGSRKASDLTEFSERSNRAATLGSRVQRAKQASCFMPGFVVLISRVGLGDDSATDWELPPAAGGGDRADEDVGVHLAAHADVAERAAVGTAGGRFE